MLAQLAKQFMDFFKKPITKESVINFLKLHFGAIILSIGVYFFKFPNHFITGGVSGISIILNRLIPSISTATLNFILNMVLMLIGLLFLGMDFGIKTAYVSAFCAVITLLFETWFPLDTPLTTQPILELVCAVGLPAVGSAILFTLDTSSGGTDIIAMLFKKYSGINVGTALIYTDFAIAAASLFIFDIETGLFSIIGLILKAILVDYVMDGIRMKKIFTIVTTNPDSICKFITDELNHSATVTVVTGAYTHEKQYQLMTVVGHNQALSLQRFIKANDPHCFMTIASCSNIIGKGFRGMSE